MVALAENKILKGGGGYNADAETQNYYVRNRYYLPTLGRWLTRDPIGYQGGINLYEFVQSSPVGNVDGAGMSGGWVPETDIGGDTYWVDNNTGAISYSYPAGQLAPVGSNTQAAPAVAPAPRGLASPPDFPPAPAGSPVCNKYPCSYTYMGANAQCFCKCAGNSPWSKYVRSCLANLYEFGASATLAHFSCYFWATEKFGVFGIPALTLARCYEKCVGPVPGAPPPGRQLWPWPPTAF